jgi:hypothetical protein
LQLLRFSLWQGQCCLGGVGSYYHGSDQDTVWLKNA